MSASQTGLAVESAANFDSAIEMTANNSPAASGSGRLPWRTIFGIALVYLLSAQGRVGNSDSASMLAVSRSLLAGHVFVPENVMGLRGLDGRWVSQFGVLMPILWMPFVLVGRLVAHLGLPLSLENCEEFVVSLYAPCLMTFALVLLADIWTSAGCPPSRVRAGLWMFGFATMLWPFAKLPGSDATCAVLLLLAYRSFTRGQSAAHLLGAGLALGLMLAARKQALSLVPVALVVWCLATWAHASKDRRLGSAIRTGALLAAGLIPGIVLYLAYLWARFGTVREPTYPGTEGVGLPPIGQWAEQSLEMLLGTRAGLLWYATPILAVFFIASGFMRRRHPATFWLIVSIAGSQVAFLACLPFWYGGTTFGPRYLVPVILLAAVSWGFIERPLTKASRVTLAVSTVVGFLVTVPGLLTDPLPVYWRNIYGKEPFWMAAAFKESAIVLGLARRPDWHSKHVEFSHPPFQVPDLWWCQFLRVAGVLPGSREPLKGVEATNTPPAL